MPPFLRRPLLEDPDTADAVPVMVGLAVGCIVFGLLSFVTDVSSIAGGAVFVVGAFLLSYVAYDVADRDQVEKS